MTDIDKTIEKAKDSGFYAGLITALAVISMHDDQVVYEEVIGTLGADLTGLVQHAQENDELEFSGLVQYYYATEDGAVVDRGDKEVWMVIPDDSSMTEFQHYDLTVPCTQVEALTICCALGKAGHSATAEQVME